MDTVTGVACVSFNAKEFSDLGAVRGISLEQIEDCTAPARFIKFCTCAGGNPRDLLAQLDPGSTT
jgi:hypothetical protein